MKQNNNKKGVTTYKMNWIITIVRKLLFILLAYTAIWLDPFMSQEEYDEIEQQLLNALGLRIES